MTAIQRWQARARELALAVHNERQYTDLSLAITAADTVDAACDVVWEIRRVQAFQPRPATLRTQAVRAQLWPFEA